MGLIILLAKFSALFCLSFLFITQIQARESFDFDVGKKINILSDKAFRKSSTNEFEAVGNVVITHMKNAIYGERAKVNFSSGEVEVVGNVRYIAPEMTLYGTRLKYNLHTREIDLDNARVLSDNYVITGKKINRPDEKKIYAQEAEYTTCRDCPESWSIYGKEINIEVGEYIYLKHAFIKVKGVVVLYFPYLVFPIKQKRETGLLFPTFGFTSDEGMRFQQPFFWAIDDYKDMTLIPSTFGDRGLGGELQYRQNIKEKTWFEFNFLGINDRIYAPGKFDKIPTGGREFRYFGEFEHHFSHKQNWNGHFFYSGLGDLDTIRDLDFYTENRLLGSEVGGGGFIETRSSLFSVTAESYFNRNILYNDPKKFDHDYVQMLPKVSLSSVPYNLFQSDMPFLKNISMGIDADFTIFKQNHVNEQGPIRNARRLNVTPAINWNLGNFGPVFFSHETKLDFQSYRLPTEEDKDFRKYSLLHETEAKIELEKIYGLAYIEEVDDIINTQENNVKKNTTIIGDLPKITARNAQAKKLIYNNSYRHSQEFKLKHYYLGDQKSKGNTQFRNQIESDDGQFDYVDALRASEYLFNQNTAYDSLPIRNTIEFQWNNGLIRKKASRFDPFKDNRYLKDNFDYKNVAYFDLSQGVDLSVSSDDFTDKLTRLYMNTGISLDRFGFNIEEFYYHQMSEHKLNTSLSIYLDRFTFTTDFTYNSYNSTNTPVSKLVGYEIMINLNDLITLKNSLEYNINTDLISESHYSFLYSPINNCWKVELTYSKDLIESKFGVLLYINYNDNNFTAINVK